MTLPTNWSDKLFNQISEWLDTHTELAQDAQILAKDIHDRGLINLNRALPFEIIPSNEEIGGFDLNVFLDHPSKAQVLINIKKDCYSFIPIPNYMGESLQVSSLDDALNQIKTYD